MSSLLSQLMGLPPLRWLELNPYRAARLYSEYDIKRGYESYWDYCRARCERKILETADEPLQQRGFAYQKIFSADQAYEIAQQLQTGYELSHVKKDSRDLLGFQVGNENWIRQTLGSILNESIDRQLLVFFGSEYLIHTITFTKTLPAEEQKSVSFRWHCDKGPRNHLKLIVYLNSTEEHGGNTEFIDLNDTAHVARRGYLFGLARKRTSEVEHLAKIAGCQIQSHRKNMAAGEGVVFQPANVLHRGLSPSRGSRFVITLCLLPSPVPWAEALARGTLSDLAVDAKWHRHASELMRKLK